MYKLNSSVPGVASSPRIEAFRESASILNGTASSIKFESYFNIFPVDADPVNVTTSSQLT